MSVFYVSTSGEWGKIQDNMVQTGEKKHKVKTQIFNLEAAALRGKTIKYAISSQQQ